MSADTAFRTVTDMELPLSAAAGLVAALRFLAQQADEPLNDALHSVACAASDELEKAQRIYVAVFRATHPDRQRLDREGWPGAEPAG